MDMYSVMINLNVLVIFSRDIYSLHILDSHNGGNKRKALGHLVSCDHYYIEMAIVLAKVRSITDCQLTCTSTPGCVFYNYKQSSGSYHCHYSDPLRGQMYTEPPDGGVGWRAYYVVHDLS